MVGCCEAKASFPAQGKPSHEQSPLKKSQGLSFDFGRKTMVPPLGKGDALPGQDKPR